MPEQRIVSLIASATEIVAELGFLDQLVGRSHECDYPARVQDLPVCTAPKLDIHASSKAIDDAVTSIVASGASVYDVHADLLESLEPTLIITQSQCEVCAVSLQDVEEALCRFVSSHPAVVALEPMNLADVWQDIRRVGFALDARERTERIVGSLEARIAELACATRSLPHPRVACLEWLDPLMFAGNWVPELVTAAGGLDCFGRPGEHSHWMTWEELSAADPEVIVLMPCGFDMTRIEQEMHVLVEHPAWAGLRAVRDGRVFITDGNQYFNRPGPRLVESAEILAEILHPGEFDFGHRGSGWTPVA